MSGRILLAVSCAVSIAIWAEPAGAQSDPGRPARNTSLRAAPATGTASISGQVLTADTGRPVKRARVLATASDPPLTRAVTTDEGGLYQIDELPAGSYTLIVSKTGFVDVSYGQRRPLGPGVRLPLGDGQQAQRIDFRLPRGSVITGHIFDQDGEPLMRTSVRALRFQYVQGERRLVQAGSDDTDDRGQFRIYGLPPGTYYVSAVLRTGDGSPRFRGGRGGQAPEDAQGRGYAPTYYPGVTSTSEALPILVGLSQEAANIEFSLQLVTTARVSGTLVGPDGSEATNGVVMMTPDDGTGQFALGPNYTGRVQDAGAFALSGIPPGRYLILARGQAASAEGLLFASQAISVSGEEVSGINLMLSAGATLSGTVSFEAGSNPPPSDLSQIRVSASSPVAMPLGGTTNARVRPDGAFVMAGIPPGARSLTASGVPGPWALKEVWVNGRDVIDTPIEFRSGQTATDARFVFTDRVSEISGSVRDGQGQPLVDCWVIAFAADPARWRPQARQIQASRPDGTGVFNLRGLPSGEYYLAAIDRAESGEWYEPAFLEGLRPGAVKIAIGEGETKSQDLRLTAAATNR